MSKLARLKTFVTHRLKYKSDALVALFVFIFSWWLMSNTFSYQNGSFVIAGRLWSDFAAHIPLVRSFSMGNNFPPEYPTFPGEPIRYHYLFYLCVGLMEKMGIGIGFAMNFMSSLGLTLLLYMIYRIAKLLSGYKRVGLLAVILFLFNGSFSFLELFKDQPLSLDLIDKVIYAKEFLSFGPWGKQIVAAFWNWNIYTNQRHLGWSFGLALLAVWPLLRCQYREMCDFRIRSWLLIWWSLILLPFFNMAAYLCVVVVIVWWSVINIRRRSYLTTVYWTGLFYSLPSLLSMPANESIHFHLGYYSADRSLVSILNYWLHNIGLYLPLLPIVFFQLKKRERCFLAPFIILFVLANVLWLSPDLINNHKLVNFFMIGMNIVVAKQFFIWWSEIRCRPKEKNTLKKNWLLKPVVCFKKGSLLLLLFLLTFSGVIDAFPVINDFNSINKRVGGVPDYSNSAVTAWIKDNTKGGSIFLTTSYMYNPASIVGRKTFTDYGYFNWSLGYADNERRKLLPQFFSSTISKQELCMLFESADINYVLFSPGNGVVEGAIPRESILYQSFPVAYSSIDGYEVIRVDNQCGWDEILKQ